MKQDKRNRAASTAPESRKTRLGEQLRANLQKRKAQVRARRTGEPDQRPDGIDPAKSASDQ